MANKTETSGSGRSARSAARLAAVQAIYQNAINPDLPIAELVEEFVGHRLGKIVDGVLMAEADAVFFAALVTGVDAEKEKLDKLIAGGLSEKWSPERLEEILRAILRAGCYELSSSREVPTAVVINEYLDVAHAFLEGKEVGFINGVLDQISKEVRSEGLAGI
jgi:N utilization substance protein B